MSPNRRDIAQVSETAVAEYLMQFRVHHSATTYNNHVCILREVFRTLADKAGPEWKLLVMTGIYTGLRLGDCRRLAWENASLERGVIQVIPEKTKKHAHGRPQRDRSPSPLA